MDESRNNSHRESGKGPEGQHHNYNNYENGQHGRGGYGHDDRGRYGSDRYEGRRDDRGRSDRGGYGHGNGRSYGGRSNDGRGQYRGGSNGHRPYQGGSDHRGSYRGGGQSHRPYDRDGGRGGHGNGGGRSGYGHDDRGQYRGNGYRHDDRNGYRGDRRDEHRGYGDRRGQGRGYGNGPSRRYDDHGDRREHDDRRSYGDRKPSYNDRGHGGYDRNGRGGYGHDGDRSGYRRDDRGQYRNGSRYRDDRRFDRDRNRPYGHDDRRGQGRRDGYGHDRDRGGYRGGRGGYGHDRDRGGRGGYGRRDDRRFDRDDRPRRQRRQPVDVPAIAVIGGGAAGLMAAVFASGALAFEDGRVSLPEPDAPTRNVVVYESQDRTGRSVLATGAGRCNVSNAHVAPDVYHNADFVAKAFADCTPDQVMSAFSHLGLVTEEEAEGRLYPVTGRATTVLDVIRFAAQRAGVDERCHRRVECLRKSPVGWFVCTPDGDEGPFVSVIVTTGGIPQARVLPTDVPQSPMVPVLGPIQTSGVDLGPVDKTRAKCVLTCAGHTEAGEVTFRHDGVSGIVAFDVSRFAKKGDVLTLNLMPFADDAAALFKARLDEVRPASWAAMCRGVFTPRVAQVVLAAAGLNPVDPVDPERVDDLAHAASHLDMTVEGVADHRLAQAHRGGVDVAAVDPATMEVAGQERVHVAGEAVDVDGPCGGFNLHWAWTSGILAGAAAAQELDEFKTAQAAAAPDGEKPADKADDVAENVDDDAVKADGSDDEEAAPDAGEKPDADEEAGDAPSQDAADSAPSASGTSGLEGGEAAEGVR